MSPPINLEAPRLNPPGVFTRGTPQIAQTFADVAFNDSGDLLYAWARGSSKELSGGLFVYRVTRLDNERPESKGYYACVRSGLSPPSRYPPCLTATAG